MSNVSKKCLIAMVATLMASAAQLAQAAPPPPQDIPEDEAAVAEALIQLNAAPIAPSTEYKSPSRRTIRAHYCDKINHEKAQNACWTAHAQRFENYENILEIRNNAFHWQHRSSQMIFVIVHLIVLAGVYLSWRQFQVNIERHSTAKDKNDSPDAGPNGGSANGNGGGPTQFLKASKVGISAGGLTVSSPVIGIIILALSLGFFYLYLETVYPINVIDSTQPQASQETTNR